MKRRKKKPDEFDRAILANHTAQLSARCGEIADLDRRVEVLEWIIDMKPWAPPRRRTAVRLAWYRLHGRFRVASRAFRGKAPLGPVMTSAGLSDVLKEVWSPANAPFERDRWDACSVPCAYTLVRGHKVFHPDVRDPSTWYVLQHDQQTKNTIRIPLIRKAKP